MKLNHSVYEQLKIVKYYANYKSLQKPEIVVFNILNDKLSKFNVLDIGIGAGRTTNFLFSIVKDYIGIDYSSEMINFCRERFKDKIPFNKLLTLDAKNISTLNRSFDFILFSFNGIDYCNIDDRFEILKNCFEAICPSGYFLFSSHNIYNLPYLTKVTFRKNIFAFVKDCFVKQRIKALNANILNTYKDKDYLIIKDDAHSFSLKTIYVCPHWQIKVLKEIGFSEIRSFSSLTGDEVIINSESKTPCDPWIYYFCKK